MKSILQTSLFADGEELAPQFYTKSPVSGAGVMPKVRNNSNMTGLSLSFSQAAEYLGVSRDTLSQLCNKRLLRSFHIGRRHFVTLDAIKEFINDQEEAEQW